jgi:hypothetical protein
MRVALVHNAKSTRNRNGMAEVELALGALPGLRSFPFDPALTMRERAAAVATASPDLIIVNGGDGTVQRLLTELLEPRLLEPMPPIAILPRGMANMTANDCGLRGRGLRALRRLASAIAERRLGAHLAQRRILRVAGAADAAPQHGMFFGAGAIWDAIQWCTGEVHVAGFKGEWANLATLVGLLGRFAVGRTPPGMLEGVEATIRSCDRHAIDGRQLLFLATTLDRLVLGSRPFWNETGEPLRFTTIGHPPVGLVRNARRVLFGRDRSGLPASYRSWGAERVTLAFDAPFTIDGEFFTASARQPLEITAPSQLAFVRL